MNASTEYEIPVFSEAVKQFHSFLVSQGIDSELLWVFREDVAWRKQKMFVKVPVSEEN